MTRRRRLRSFLRGFTRSIGINPPPRITDTSPAGQLDRANLVFDSPHAAWVGRLRSTDEELDEFFERHRKGRT